MKLEPGKKLEKNLRLMRSCSQVRIIQLTEEIDNFKKKQESTINRNPELKNMLTNILREQLIEEGALDVVDPKVSDLVGLTIPGFDPTIDSEPVKNYMWLTRSLNGRERALGDYKQLHEILSKRSVSFEEFEAFINSTDNSRAFQKFVNNMKESNPMVISVLFKHQANELAERNGLATPTYYENANRTFTADSTKISLGKDVRGRLVTVGKTLAASVALVAVLTGAGLSFVNNSQEVVQGDKAPHGSYTEQVPIPEEPVIAVSPEETPNPHEGPISINESLNSYEDACNDFFKKTAEVYKYNTGEDINLSGYGQSNIGINRNARILVIEKDGVTYRISTQSFAAPNAEYLRKAFEELGVEFTEETTKTTCIIDKYDSTKSIAIVDGAGNPVRSGNVLTDAGSGGYMYNQDMVRGGREILEAEGRSGSSLSEAQCVAAFLLSDRHNTQNPELSIALGRTAGLASTIKDTFYGKSDSYAVYLYSQDARKFAENFNSAAQEAQQGTKTQTDMEHDER